MHQYSEPYVNVPPPGSRNHLTGGVWGEWPVGKSLLTHDYRTDLSNTEKRSALASSEEDIEEW